MRVLRVGQGAVGSVTVAMVAGGIFVALVKLASAGPAMTDVLRFRPVQVIPEVVIDLTDSDLFEVPRYNTYALADVDNDDAIDIVAVNNDDDVINLYLGNGDGTFEDSTVIDPFDFENSGTTGLIAVVVEDFGGPFLSTDGSPDGNLDIAAIDGDGVIDIFLGDGDGEFVEVLSVDLIDFGNPDEITGAVSGVFDGGDVGLAFADSDEVILLCNDSGVFGSCTTPGLIIDEGLQLEEAPIIVDIAKGDFDDDGNLDIAVLAPNVGLVFPIFGDGVGGFEVGTQRLGYPSENDDGLPAAFAVGNFNGGGDDIVIFGSGFENTAQVSSGLSGGRFNTAVFPTEETSSVLVGSFDRDDDNSVDVLFSQASTVAFLAGDGTGDFSSSQGAQPLGEPGVEGRRVSGANVLKSADLNGDTLLDIVALVADGSELIVALNVIDQPTVTPAPISPSPTRTPTGPTPTPTQPQPTDTPTPFPTIPLGRCNVDPNPDKPELSMPPTFDEIFANPLVAIDAGDFDGDGNADIVVADEDTVYVLTNPGREGMAFESLMACVRDRELGETTPVLFPISRRLGFSGPLRDVAAIDVDGDGNDEIAVTHDDRLSVIVTNGTGSDVIYFVDDEDSVQIPGEPGKIAADRPNRQRDQGERQMIDFNDDGEADLFVANGDRTQVAVLRGVAGSSSFALDLFDVGGATSHVAAGDFNEDGQIDFAASSGSRITYVVRQGNTFTTAGGGRVELRDDVLSMDSGFVFGDGRADILISDTSNNVRALLSQSNLSAPTRAVILSTPAQPGVVAALPLTSPDIRLDAVVAVPARSTILVATGSADGGFGTSIMPLRAGLLPMDLVGVDLDNDRVMDLVTANRDGTLTILVSGVPPVTPTPTETGTPTSTDTGTPTPTHTPTNTFTGTETATAEGDTPTPTNTKEGIFELSGGGCSVNGDPANGAWALLIGLLTWGIALSMVRRGYK